MAAATDSVSVDIDIADGETTIVVTGEREAAVVVRSAGGERVYLPPERADESESNPYEGRDDGPYEGLRSESPYEGIPSETPYGSARGATAEMGLTATANGFRIRHPEPATDVRFLR